MRELGDVLPSGVTACQRVDEGKIGAVTKRGPSGRLLDSSYVAEIICLQDHV